MTNFPDAIWDKACKALDFESKDAETLINRGDLLLGALLTLDLMLHFAEKGVVPSSEFLEMCSMQINIDLEGD